MLLFNNTGQDGRDITCEQSGPPVAPRFYGRHVLQTNFLVVTWKLISDVILFVSWPLIGSNPNMLGNKVNKIVWFRR
jgi:cobalamin-dependent methionine synthase I